MFCMKQNKQLQLQVSNICHVTNKSYIIMRLNCLQAKFSQLKMLVDTFAENNAPIQVLCL